MDISGAVKQNFAEATKNEVESTIKVWLHHSGEKLRKLESKAVNARREGEFYIKSTAKKKERNRSKYSETNQ